VRLRGPSDAHQCGLMQLWLEISTERKDIMTLIWFLVWLVANLIGDKEPLRLDPVNLWTGTLLLAIALDLSRQHAEVGGWRRG